MKDILDIASIAGALLLVFLGSFWIERRFERWERREDEKILARHREDALRAFELQVCQGCTSCEPR